MYAHAPKKKSPWFCSHFVIIKPTSLSFGSFCSSLLGRLLFCLAKALPLGMRFQKRASFFLFMRPLLRKVPENTPFNANANQAFRRAISFEFLHALCRSLFCLCLNVSECMSLWALMLNVLSFPYAFAFTRRQWNRVMSPGGGGHYKSELRWKIRVDKPGLSSPFLILRHHWRGNSFNSMTRERERGRERAWEREREREWERERESQRERAFLGVGGGKNQNKNPHWNSIRLSFTKPSYSSSSHSQTKLRISNWSSALLCHMRCTFGILGKTHSQRERGESPRTPKKKKKEIGKKRRFKTGFPRIARY